MELRYQKFHSRSFFSLWAFFVAIEDSQESREGEWTMSFPFHCFYPLANTQKHLIIVLYLRWVISIINCNPCNYRAPVNKIYNLWKLAISFHLLILFHPILSYFTWSLLTKRPTKYNQYSAIQKLYNSINLNKYVLPWTICILTFGPDPLV